MIWTYSGEMYDRETIEQLAEDYLRAVRDLVKRGLSGEEVVLSAADFPKARIKQEHLDKLLTKLKRN